MANATAKLQLGGVGVDGRRLHLPCKTGTTIYEGTMVAQQIADGLLVPATSAATWPAIGKATHTVENAAAGQRLVVETDRIFAISNGAGGDAFSEASQLGAPVYAFDDHTGYDNDAAGTLQQCGTYQGLEADGKILVKMSPDFAVAATTAQGAGLQVQRGTGTFAAGVLTVTGVTLRSTSVIIFSRKTEAGTDGDEIRSPSADRTVGLLGTGQFVARSFLSGVAATSDTSTFDWVIVG